ncbi:MAG: NUDIX domain-containing protein [Kiloniellales bacterium]|nr:NUDIX domain-containing protein [Kiloniellales bacterium]
MSDQTGQIPESAGEDPRAYERPSVTVDLALLSVREGALCVLLLRRDRAPFLGAWSLPGGFVRIEESLDEAAMRILRDKAQMSNVFMEQLFTFGAVDRDPRARVITVAYYALVEAGRFDEALKASVELSLFEILVPWADETGGAVAICSAEGETEPLAFDHAEILGMAVKRLRGKLDYTPVGFELLPERFTLRQLQEVHEAILDRRMNKPAFRRRMLDKGGLQATGERESGVTYRPAELYRFLEPNAGPGQNQEG